MVTDRITGNTLSSIQAWFGFCVTTCIRYWQSMAADVQAPRSRSATTTPVRSRFVATRLVRSQTVTNDLPGYDSGSICTLTCGRLYHYQSN
ncbi:hypothetical protein WN943_027428 [Citrus x changshan-huyou]